MKSFKEYLIEEYRILGLFPAAKEIRKSDAFVRYGPILRAMVDHMKDESNNVLDSDNISGVYLFPPSNLRPMWLHTPKDKFPIVGWYKNGKVNIITDYNLNDNTFDAILDYDDNFMKEITKLKPNTIKLANNEMLIVDFSPKKQKLQYISVKKRGQD